MRISYVLRKFSKDTSYQKIGVDIVDVNRLQEGILIYLSVTLVVEGNPVSIRTLEIDLAVRDISVLFNLCLF